MGLLSFFGTHECGDQPDNESNPFAPCRTPAMAFVFVYFLMTAPMAFVLTLSLIIGRCLRLRDGTNASSNDPGFFQQLGAYLGISLLWPFLLALCILSLAFNLAVNWPFGENYSENWTDVRPQFMRGLSKGDAASGSTNPVVDDVEACIAWGAGSGWRRRGWLIMLRARCRGATPQSNAGRQNCFLWAAKMQMNASFAEEKERYRIMGQLKWTPAAAPFGDVSGDRLVPVGANDDSACTGSVSSAATGSTISIGTGSSGTSSDACISGVSLESRTILWEAVMKTAELEEDALFRSIIMFL